MTRSGTHNCIKSPEKAMDRKPPKKRRRLQVNSSSSSDDEGPPTLDGPYLTVQQAQEQEAENENVVAKAMSIMLIAEEVFKFLPVRDLLNCSLVNRSWNTNARNVLRENKKCIARIDSMRPCEALEELNSVMRHTAVVPINGLSIFTDQSDDHNCVKCTGLDLSRLYSVILTRMKIKYFLVHWIRESICPAVGLIEKLFTEKSANIVELSVFRLPSKIKSLVSHFQIDLKTQQHWLPNVKTLELPRGVYDLHTSVANELVCAASRASKIKGEVLPVFIESIVSEGKTSAVQEFALKPQWDDIQLRASDQDQDQNADDSVEEYLQATLRFAKQEPKIKKMLISTYFILLRCNFRHAKLRLISEILTVLLKSSSNALQELRISHLDLILLSYARIVSEPLNLVNHLTIDYYGHLDVNDGYSTLRKIDFQSMFPNLQSIELCRSFFLQTEIYVTDEFLGNPMEYSCTTVSKLKIDPEWDISKANINFLIHYLAKVFPGVKTFRMDNCKKMDGFCSALWTAWSDIETIMFTSVGDDSVKRNLDCCFTGLKRRECKTLREAKNYDSFQQREERSSILNLTKLKKFLIDISHWTSCQRGGNGNTNEVFLSEVTGRYAFSQMPNLTVEINRRECDSDVECRFALTHLQPYVKLVDADADFWNNDRHIDFMNMFD